jgi:hypothetical protein
MANKGVESGLGRIPQLYDLTKDPGEQNNLADQNPELVNEMQSYINKVVNKKAAIAKEKSRGQ